MCYVNHQGGTKSPLLSAEVKSSVVVGLNKAHLEYQQSICQESRTFRQITSRRRFNDNTEWSLDRQVFQRMSNHLNFKLGSRHVRFEDELSNSEVCNLASRSRGVGNGRPINIMVGNDAIPVSAIRHDSAGAAKMQVRSTKTRSSNSASVEQSTMVSRSSIDVVARSNSTNAARPSSLSTRWKDGHIH